MVDQSYQSPLLMQATNGKLDLHLQGHRILHLDAYFARLRFRSSLSALYCLIIEYNIEKQKVKAESAGKIPLYNHTFFDEGFCSSRKLLLSVLLLPLFFTSLSTWVYLSLYFGSLIANNILIKLTVYTVNLDHRLLGNQAIDGIKASETWRRP